MGSPRAISFGRRRRTQFSTIDRSNEFMNARWMLISILAVSLCGCAAFKQTTALSQVKFSFDRISDVRVAGVTVQGKTSYTDLSVTDIAKLSSAVVAHDVPLGLTVHLKAENPSSNSVTA